MKKLSLLVFTLLLVLQLSAQDTAAIYRKLDSIAIIDQKVMMPMRDGIRLATDIYRPKGNQQVPIVFSRTPYNFNTWVDGKMTTRALEEAYAAVSRGYAYVVQNERGRFFSEGDWDILGTPLTDGYDAFEWMSKQAWSNGKIGVIGCSSTAEWQMAAASLNHPALAAMVAQGFGAGVGRVGKFQEQGNWYRGGLNKCCLLPGCMEHSMICTGPGFPKISVSKTCSAFSGFMIWGRKCQGLIGQIN